LRWRVASVVKKRFLAFVISISDDEFGLCSILENPAQVFLKKLFKVYDESFEQNISTVLLQSYGAI
jgi:hypothetical protein